MKNNKFYNNNNNNLSGPHEGRVLNFQTSVQTLKRRHKLVAVIDRTDICFICRVSDFLSVFIRASEEEAVVAQHSVEPHQRIRRKELVGVTNVREAIRVCDRC